MATVNFLPLLACVCTLSGLLSASPLGEVAQSESDAPSPLSSGSFKNAIYKHLQVRNIQVSKHCRNNNDCLADKTLGNVTTDLVRCDLVSQECLCSMCFMLDSQGKCSSTVCPDYPYNKGTTKCSDDNRKSQLTAFLLTLFLAQFGAANFYIGQNGLGGGQIALFIGVLIFSYCVCCLPFILASCCVSDSKDTSAKAAALETSFLLIIPMTILIVLIIFASVALSVWSLADLIIFALNHRPAGNGCPLKPWH